MGQPWRRLFHRYDDKLRILPRTHRGTTYAWCKPGRIIKPTAKCAHTFDAIIQPGDYERIRNCWFQHCPKCRGLVTGEAKRKPILTTR